MKISERLQQLPEGSLVIEYFDEISKVDFESEVTINTINEISSVCNIPYFVAKNFVEQWFINNKQVVTLISFPLRC